MTPRPRTVPLGLVLAVEALVALLWVIWVGTS
jgi:hypothetical protein